MNISVAFLSKYELAKLFTQRLYLCTLLASLLEVVTMKEALVLSKKLSKMPSIVVSQVLLEAHKNNLSFMHVYS